MTAQPLPTGTEYDELLDSLRTRQPWAAVPERGRSAEWVMPPTVVDWVDVPSMIAHHEPDTVALAAPGRVVTYAELMAWSGHVACRLREQGVGRGDVVAVVTDRGPELPVAMLAVWLAGAAFLPLGARHPAAWRADVARQAGAAACLGRRGQDAVPGLPRIDVDDAYSGAEAAPERLRPDDLAYVMYTSGSTGVPKLAMVEHGGVANVVRAQRDCLAGVGPTARVLQCNDPTFDGSVFDLLLALAHGGRLVCPDASVTSGDPLAEALRQGAVTHATLPAAVVRTLEPGAYGGLVSVLSVGDVCRPDTAVRWSGHCQFVNAYGPTETSIWATWHVATPEDGDRGFVPIGVAVPGCAVSVVDDALRPVPAGALGEIVIGGIGVGRGYLGDPGRTAERFVTDATGARRYRTGDLGRVLADGSVQFVGRRDLQVKVRGYRVEPEYVEAALAGLPGVLDAAVVADGRGMTGYARTAGAPAPTGPDLVGALGARLPAYLVPDRIEVRSDWPLTASGKIDRAALRDHRAEPDTTESRPLHRALSSLVAELLDVPRVAPDDDFFALGAHSLLAAQLAARIRTELRRAVQLGDVLRNPTVDGLADVVAAAEEVGPDGPEPVAGFVPTPSFAQRRVLLMDEISAGSGAYRAQVVLRLAGPLDVAALEAGLTDVVRRHDVLRSRFVVDGDRTTVEVLPPWRVVLPVVDHSDLPASEQRGAVAAAVREIVGRPLDVARDRLIRWLLIRLADDEHVFVQVEHHTVHDGWSFNVLLRDLVEGYLDHQEFGAVARPDPPLGYYGFVDWQTRWVRGPEAGRQREFWRTALAGAPTTLQLPRKPAGTRRRFTGRSPRLLVDSGLATGLAELSRREGTSLFVTMLSAFFALLHRFGAGDDLLVASGLANRRWRSTEDLLGMFVNTVVLRGTLTDDPSFRTLLLRVRDMALAAYDNQDLPFEDVIDVVDPERVAGVNPLVQAAFSFHDSPIRTLRAVPWDVTYVEALANGSAKFDLNLVVVPEHAEPGHTSRLPGDVVTIPRSTRPVRPSSRTRLGGITMLWEFAVDVLDATLVEAMMAAYLDILRAVVRDVEQPVSRLPLLTAARAREVVELGRGATAPVADARIEAIVAGWATRTPDALAVRSERGDLTYRDLVGRAGALAGRLVAAGVRRGDVVAVCLPSGAELIVSILAVLQAGAAYLPLDPKHPESRRGLLAGDSGVRVAIAAAPFGGLRVVSPRAGTAAPPVSVGTPADLAYLIHTSGSTGTPKAVQVPHRALVHRLGSPGFLGLGPDTVFLHAAPAIFDMSALEVWGPLLHGGAVRVPPSGWDTHTLGRFLAGSDVTHVVMVPAPAAAILGDVPTAFDGVDQVMIGGEVVPPDVIRRLRAGGAGTVSTIYGPTETTVIVAQWVAPEQVDGTRPVPLGRPWPNSRLVVADAEGRVVPRGVVGEIHIGGPGVTNGYLGRPALTAERFVADPEVPGGRLYRSGDVGRWNADGDLEFLGRLDDQVKVRGFRIEPGEVQAALTALPDVTGAVVTTPPDSTGAAILAAHVTLADGADSTGADLKARLSAVLPEYLIPSVVTVVDEFPLTDSGKVDRARLPLPTSGTEYVGPRDATERVLAQIMAELLGVERVGVFDDFFALGGHSLLAARLAARLRDTVAGDVGLTDVLANPTVAELAALPRQRSVTTIPRLPR